MNKNSLRMPTYGPYAASTLCERSARPRRGRRTLTGRPQHTDVGQYNLRQFHEPSACWQQVLNVKSTYGLRVFRVHLPYKNR